MEQIIKMTDVEQMTMYMKLPKIELVNMLIQCNKVINQITPIIELDICDDFFSNISGEICSNCGKEKWEH